MSNLCEIHTQIPNNIDCDIVNHLLFHQAIGEGGINIDKYLQILGQLNTGDHVGMEDPRDRTMALVFELVIQEDFNPWNIDLKRFSMAYLDRIKDDFDFITAGRLIFMAFRILRLQSTELLESLSEPEDSYDDYMDIEDWMEDDSSYTYTRRVIAMKESPVEECIIHRGDRHVTLFELVEAFHEAASETEEMQEKNLRMRKERNRQAKLRRMHRKRVGGQVHDEDYHQEIEKVYSALLGIKNGLKDNTITFAEFLPHSPADDITTFISLLFLNFNERIKVWQENFPTGDLFIRIFEQGEATIEPSLLPVIATEA